MKPKYLTAILAGLLLLLAACTPIQPLAPEANAPTAPPVLEPERITSVAELTAVPLQWVRLIQATEQLAVEEPEKFTVNFTPDGTLSVLADCNQAAATYTADDTGSLSIQMGPMTAAACPEGSIGEEFVRLLSGAANFFFENGELFIDTFADSGTLVFAPADEAMPVTGSVGAAPTAFSEAWQSVPCDTFDIDPAVAARADCGYVTVPENRAAGTESTIKLGVVRIHSDSANPGAPLFEGTGGPGGAGLGAVAVGAGEGFLTDKAGILADRDWVSFTQRGTKYAIPELGCPDFDTLAIEAAADGWTLEERGQKVRDVIIACADEFRAQGVDLSGYNTNENAADVDAIRSALGYDKIIFYGESYGTQLGQFVMRNYPDILEAVMLDGVVPVTAQMYSEVTDFPGAFKRVFDACAADAECNAAYPDLENVLSETISGLRANPVPYTLTMGANKVPIVIDDLLAMNSLFIQLFFPGGYAGLPQIIYDLHAGDTAGLNASLPAFLSVNSSARVMHFAVNCSDLPMSSLDQIGLEGEADVYARVDQEDSQQFVYVCPALGVPELGPESDQLIESDIPTLILQGGFDPATPPSGGENVATGLPNSTMVLVPSGTHVQSGNPCVLDIMRAFMNDPQAEPDLSCIDPEVAFKYPAPVSYVDPASSATISVTLPPSYVPIANGQWTNGDLLLIIAAIGADKSVDTFLAETAAALAIDAPEVVDGPTIAGMPSLTFQGEMAGNPVDVFVFGDDQGTYRVISDVLKQDRLDYLRSEGVFALLETVTVGGE